MIKILHTGDIHLDSPFSSLDSRQAEVRRNELRAAFTSMMTYARMNSADLILISGDMFDAEFITRDTLALICREFENYKKPIFISPGNHDPASPGSVWTKNIFPGNVHVFKSEEVERVDVDSLNVSVYGFGFTSPDMESVPIAGREVEERERINLLVCHCDMLGLKKHNTDCPMTAEILDGFGADYSALGHIHNPPEAGHDNRWCYSGCLEGRAFDELGPKGACIVEISKRGLSSEVTIKRLRFSKRRYEKGELDVTGVASNTEITERIEKYISEKRYGEDTLLSLRLTGSISPELVVDVDSLAEGSWGLFTLKLSDGTRPEMNEEFLARDFSIKGEIYRALLPQLNSADAREREIALRALRYAFSALSGDTI